MGAKLIYHLTFAASKKRGKKRPRNIFVQTPPNERQIKDPQSTNKSSAKTKRKRKGITRFVLSPGFSCPSFFFRFGWIVVESQNNLR